MNRKVQRICVYCGSGNGHNPAYTDAARTLGHGLAEAGLGLVYGGGSLGLMGEVARATLAAGGRVTGIIPQFLRERERPMREIQELIVTASMHERKQMMFEKSDAIVALPGGVGTLEELVEQLTWSQLGQHSKPIVLANIHGFWRPLLMLFDQMRSEGFIRAGLQINPTVVATAQEIIPAVLEAAAERKALAGEMAIPSKF